MSLGRRQILVSLGLVAVGGAVGLRFSLEDEDAPDQLPRLETLTLGDLGRQLGDLQALGRRYLERFPEEPTTEALTAGLQASLEASGAWPPTSSLRRAFLASSSRDFAHGETFETEGWVLSRTEGRLAGLTVASRSKDQQR